MKTNCHAEYPELVKWGKEQIEIHLYNKHYHFRQHDFNSTRPGRFLSTYPQPTYIVASKAAGNGYQILLLQMNGVFQDEKIPKYTAVREWFPKTWGLLVLNEQGDVVHEYRHITPEQLQAAETGKIDEQSLQTNVIKALKMDILLGRLQVSPDTCEPDEDDILEMVSKKTPQMENALALVMSGYVCL